jgi:predicted TIM-barrel fold metal-dependent hydrolase
MLGVVDADTHIAESQGIWEFIDEEMYPRRPVLVSIPDDTLYDSSNAFWLIDGNIFPKPSGKGGFRLVTPSEAKSQSSRGDITIASREITDPKIRLADMDRLGIHIQVIYPTLFLIYLTDDAALETSLCRAYNKFLANVWAADEERLRWVAVLPLRSIEASLAEMRTAKENGATGVFFRGLEGNLPLDDPYFFPVYKEAENLDLPICIHTGSGAPALTELFNLERNHTFAHGRALPLFAFRDLVHNGIPELFPKLRFGFVEASAGCWPINGNSPTARTCSRNTGFSLRARQMKTFRISPIALGKTISSSGPTTAITILPPNQNCWKRWRSVAICRPI